MGLLVQNILKKLIVRGFSLLVQVSQICQCFLLKIFEGLLQCKSLSCIFSAKTGSVLPIKNIFEFHKGFCLLGHMSTKLFFELCRIVLKHGWLFWVKWSFETVFQSILGLLPEKEREIIGDRKIFIQCPPAPNASTVGCCPTISFE